MHKASTRWLWGLVAWGVQVLACLPNLGRQDISDSYAILLLGKHSMAGHGYVTSAVRDLYHHSPWPVPSRSFPPVLPFLVGLCDAIFHFEIVSGFVVNLLSLAAILALLLQLPHKQVRPEYTCALVVLFVFLNTGFRGEVVSGLTMPLHGVWVTAMACLCAHANIRDSKKRAVALGMLLGLAALTRFDATLLVVVLPMALWCRWDQSWRQRLHMAALTWGSAALLYAPWALRNLATFGHLFASDNDLLAAAVTPDNCLHGYPAATMVLASQAPVAWVTQRLGYLAANIKLLFLAPRHLGAAVVCPLLLLWRRHHLLAYQRRLAGFTLVYVVCSLVSVSVTPFLMARYMALPTLLLWVTSLHVIASAPLLLPKGAHTVNSGSIRRVALCVVAGGATLLGVRAWQSFGSTALGCGYYCGRARDAEAAFTAYLPKNAIVASAEPEPLSYYTHWRTLSLLENSHAALSELQPWRDDWHPDFAIVDETWRSTLLPLGKVVAESPAGLWLIDLRT